MARTRGWPTPEGNYARRSRDRGNNPRRTRKMPDRRAPHRSRRSSSPHAMGNTIVIARVNYPIAGVPHPINKWFTVK